MAKIVFKGLPEYMEKIQRIGASIEGIIKYAVYPAAGLVADEIRAAAPEDTGDLKDSLVISPFWEEKGAIGVTITFVGYDRNGTPNALKAAVLESGSSKMAKRPFIRPAVNRTKLAAEYIIDQKITEKIDQIMNGKE